MTASQFRPGELVEVRPAEEIIRTLDHNGALEDLPFMPEMVAFSGRRFRVSRRVVKTCFSGPVSAMRGFRNNDVVTLDGIRCSGQAHDGCQKACMIFWRDAWLSKVEDGGIHTHIVSCLGFESQVVDATYQAFAPAHFRFAD